MDAFEQVVAELLWSEGYWVQTSVKVNLTKEEKALINRPTTPRWELDVVGYKANENKLLVLECKSFLDSTGVKAADLKKGSKSTRYKLFTDEALREVVFNRLVAQMVAAGSCKANAKVILGLAVGKMANTQVGEIHEHFEKSEMELWDIAVLRKKLSRLSQGQYENSVVNVVAKLLLRT